MYVPLWAGVQGHCAAPRCGLAVNAGGMQVWGYDQGYCYCTGVGHSGAVTRVRVSPDRAFIVSVGSEGGIFVWKFAQPGAQSPLDAAGATAAAGGAVAAAAGG